MRSNGLSCQPGLLQMKPMQWKVSSWHRVSQVLPCTQPEAALTIQTVLFVWHLQNGWALETSDVSFESEPDFLNSALLMPTFLFVMALPSECAGMISKRHPLLCPGPHFCSKYASYQPVIEGKGGIISILEIGRLRCWELNYITHGGACSCP